MPLRVLVVGDHPDCADSLRLLLALHGWAAVHPSARGAAAAEEFRPGAVVLDLRLPAGALLDLA